MKDESFMPRNNIIKTEAILNVWEVMWIQGVFIGLLLLHFDCHCWPIVPGYCTYIFSPISTLMPEIFLCFCLKYIFKVEPALLDSDNTCVTPSAV